jgi:ribonuclease HI
MSPDVRTIYTDGASCPHTGGDGGWSYVVVVDGEAVVSRSGRVKGGTNNACELTAVIHALQDHPGEPLHIMSDSRILLDGVLQHHKRWETNGWRTSKRRPVKNRELWERLLATLRARTAHTEWTWVRGHDNDEFNALADRLAFAAKSSV